jgi:predicted lipoprotein with Yx(FWY)xxD motif
MNERAAVRDVRGLIALACALAAMAAIAGCGSSSSSSSSAATTSTPAGTAQTTAAAPAGAGVVVTTGTVHGLGPILVDAQGKTLYAFVPDNRSKVSCVSSCALVWPPLKLSAGAQPTAAGAVKPSLLSSLPNPEGGRVVTYGGWPLYGYAGDTGPGTAKGQGLNLNGGLWYVIGASGQLIHQTP